MANKTTLERFEGDTLAFSGVIKTASTIAPSQWIGAAVELLIIDASTREPVTTIGGVLAISGTTTKRVTLTGGVMPAAGFYYFRVRVTFAAETQLTFPNGARWNTLHVIKAT